MMRLPSVRFGICLALLFTAASSPGATNFVRMVNFAFQPRLLTNFVGDWVIWTNTTGTSHNTVSSNTVPATAWSSTLFVSPQTFPFRFTNAGVFGYRCTPHAGSGMTGIIYVQPPPNAAPLVALTNPPNNAALVAPAAVTLQASASDPGGAVTNVQFFHLNSLLGADAVAPYALVVSNLTAQTYSFTARAFDNLGAVSTSAVVSVPVVNLRFGSNLVYTSTNFDSTLQVTPGRRYAVDTSSNLVAWTEVTNFMATSASIPLRDLVKDISRRYYRARVVNP